ncbi:MAG TPA: protein kinase, partial [Candidatus Binatia bacterium]|nr:protein kinase [Candidatus Binatia bacterium]
GLVKFQRADNPNLTTDGTVAGTPAYLPPERILGAVTDERSDLYSLGCVAYWMLTGQTVFRGEPTTMMIAHARTAPEPPSKVARIAIPERLEQIVLACLEKKPENRPQSALDLWHQLGEVTLETPWSLERAESWWREHTSRLSEAKHEGNNDRTQSLLPLP